MTADKKPRWEAGVLLEKAFVLARSIHAQSGRKDLDDPYIGHLMGVAALVIDHGGSEVQTAAALLHDAVEDSPMTTEGLATLISPKVADIVDACSDSYGEDPETGHKAPWRGRKEAYIERLHHKSDYDPSLLVALADKVNNAEKSASDIAKFKTKDERLTFWKKFNAGYEDQYWWYNSLLTAFQCKQVQAEDKAKPLLNRFEAAVNAMFPDGKDPR